MVTSTAFAAAPSGSETWSAKCTITKGNRNIIVSTSFPRTVSRDEIIGSSIWQVAKIAKSLSLKTIMFKKFECSETEFAGSKAGGGCFLVANDVGNARFSKDSNSPKKVIVLVDEILLSKRFENLATRCPIKT
jgi:hypothetical protein